MLLGELSRNTESGFYQWLKNHEVNFEEAKDHDLFVVAHKLSKENFVLIVTSKSLLKNVPKENQSGIGFLAVDTTHKLISCQFKFSTLITATINKEMADIAYIIHSNEDSSTFTYAFKEIKKALKEYLKLEWKVNVNIISSLSYNFF